MGMGKSPAKTGGILGMSAARAKSTDLPRRASRRDSMRPASSAAQGPAAAQEDKGKKRTSMFAGKLPFGAK